MTTFVINLRNISVEAIKLSSELSYMRDNEITAEIINFKLDEIIEEISTFYVKFQNYLAEMVSTIRPGEDIYGNQFIGLPAYSYAEISYNYVTRFNTIRLLGISPNGFKIRFYLSDVPNPFYQTTLNLIQNIKDINEPVDYFKEFFSCDPQRKNKWANDWELITKGISQIGESPPRKYNWEQLSKKFFSPKPIYRTEEMTDAEIEAFQREMANNGPFTSKQLDKFLIGTEENKQRIADKADNKKEKSKTIGEKQKELQEALKDNWVTWTDKYSVSCLIKEALDCVVPKNLTCRQLFENLPPGQLFSRIKAVFPQGSNTINELENVIVDALLGKKTIQLKKEINDLRKWIQEDRNLKSLPTTTEEQKENLDNKIREKEEKIASLQQQLQSEMSVKQEELGISSQQTEEYMQKGDIGVLLFALEQENQNPLTITNAILSAIDLIIPIESICEGITSALSGNGIPEFELPSFKKPATDPLGGISFELDNAFQLAIQQAVLSLLDSIISELVNCDNLDRFIAQIVSQNTAEGTGGLEPLKVLFGGGEDLFGEDGILDRSYDKVIDTLSEKAGNIVNVNSAGQKIGIGFTREQFTGIINPNSSTTTFESLKNASQTITDSFESAALSVARSSSLFDSKVKNSESRWDIDSTGTRFEIEAGTQLINLEEVDKFFASLEREKLEEIQSRSDVSVRALADAAGDSAFFEESEQQNQNNSTSSGLVSTTEEDRRTLKQELDSVFRSLISVLSPSQFLSFLAGTATQQTKDIAYELYKISDNTNLSLLVNNQESFIRLIYSFGSLSGLNNLEDEVQLLVESPEFQQELNPSRCGDFANISDFRQSLMSNLIEEDKARQIVQELESQRVDKFQDMIGQLSDLLEGKMNTSSVDRNSALLAAVKAAQNGGNISQAISDTNTPKMYDNKSAIETIQAQKASIENASPVLQNMFKMVIDSLFNPIESTFVSDMKSLGEASSEIEEVIEQTPRTIKIFGGPFNAFSQDVINPKFKQMVDSGLIPIIDYDESPVDENGDFKPILAKMVDKSLLVTETFPPTITNDEGEQLFPSLPPLFTYLADDPDGSKGQKKKNSFDQRPALKYKISGEIDNQFLSPGLNGVGVPPIEAKVNKRVVGSSIKRNITNFNFTDEITADRIRFTIAGSLEKIGDDLINNIGSQEEMKQIMQDSKPTWSIVFEESNTSNEVRNRITLTTTGKTISNINGPEDFFMPSFSYSDRMTISDDVYPSLLGKYGDDTNKKRKEVFDDIIVEQLKELIYQPPEIATQNIFIRDFSRNSLGFYRNFIDNFIKGLSSNLSSPRLLKAAETLSNGEVLTELEILDFIKCAVDGDLTTVLKLNEFRQEMKNVYDKVEIPEPTRSQLRGEEKRETKITKSAKMILSNMYIRIICLDFVIKALPMLDQFKFSNSLVRNQMLINIVSEYIVFELRRNSLPYLNLIEFVESGVVDYHNLKEFREISRQERREHSNAGYSFSIELKESVARNINIILDECRQITGTRELDRPGQDDFISTIIDSYSILDTSIDNGFNEEDETGSPIFSSLPTKDGIVLQKFIYIPEINTDSQVYKGNREYFDNIQNFFGRVTSLDEAQRVFSEIYYGLGINFDLYVCEGDQGYENRLLSTPYEVGLRIVSYELKEDGSGKNIVLNGSGYPYDQAGCEKSKLGYIRENENEYDIFQLAEERLRVNAKQSIGVFVGSNNQLRFKNEFEQRLKTLLILDQEVELLLGFSLPLKEITSMLLVHFSLSNNDEKMKYLFEPTKKIMTEMIDYLDSVGNNALSSQRIKENLEKQQREKDNVGNPAGPLNPEALKLFYRTPIQILKSLTVITDPNVAITDKVIRTISAATSLLPPDLKPPFIPYSLVSLSLAPFPIFQPPPAGIIPPLTSYNVASPLNYIFFALEPLLWDLPYFQNYNVDSVGEKNVCSDESDEE